MMGRREFITLLGGAAAWPRSARAQQPEKIPKIGYLDVGPASARADRVEALRAGLHAGHRLQRSAAHYSEAHLSV
jgi:putative ABC transport system substrate-binding protein